MDIGGHYNFLYDGPQEGARYVGSLDTNNNTYYTIDSVIRPVVYDAAGGALQTSIMTWGGTLSDHPSVLTPTNIPPPPHDNPPPPPPPPTTSNVAPPGSTGTIYFAFSTFPGRPIGYMTANNVLAPCYFNPFITPLTYDQWAWPPYSLGLGDWNESVAKAIGNWISQTTDGAIGPSDVTQNYNMELPMQFTPAGLGRFVNYIATSPSFVYHDGPAVGKRIQPSFTVDLTLDGWNQGKTKVNLNPYGGSITPPTPPTTPGGSGGNPFRGGPNKNNNNNSSFFGQDEFFDLCVAASLGIIAYSAWDD